MEYCMSRHWFVSDRLYLSIVIPEKDGKEDIEKGICCYNGITGRILELFGYAARVQPGLCGGGEEYFINKASWVKHLPLDAGVNVNVKELFVFAEGLQATTLIDLVGRSMECILLNKIVQNSQKFNENIKEFPTTKNRIANIADTAEKKQEVVEHARSTYKLMHKKTHGLIYGFLEMKQTQGNDKEKALYKSMDLDSFINRLVTKRPLMFLGFTDNFILRSGGPQVIGGTKRFTCFDNIGTDEEGPVVSLEEYLSYEEMQISALLSFMVPTHFINSGGRANRGLPDPAGTYEEKGIYVAQVGARFEREGKMEWQHMVVTPQQNTAENGYGGDRKENSSLEMWASLYRINYFPSHGEALEDKSGRYVPIKYIDLNNNEAEGFLDVLVYKLRMQVIVAPFLLQAQRCGSSPERQVYVQATGIGLGSWALDEKSQTRCLLQAYLDIIKSSDLSHISDINFSWIDEKYAPEEMKNGSKIKDRDGHEIKIHFSQRTPADKLKGDDEGKLLYTNYAFDSNSYPGNEYWGGVKGGTADPAAASCSTVAELQNPLINPYLISNAVRFLP